VLTEAATNERIDAGMAHRAQRASRDSEDLRLLLRARNGDLRARDALILRYKSFVRLRASSYFIAGGDQDDLQQEGLLGLHKAILDYRHDKDTSFRSFAELCVHRQIITAVKRATRLKHQVLSTALSFSFTPAGQDPDGSDCTLGDALPGSPVNDPCVRVIASEETNALVALLKTDLSPLESRVLVLFLDGESYEAIAERVGCDPKAVDNALQRVKRKINTHRSTRAAF
jgi:RNA polymerase sporulation-specific sigma factor